MENKILIIYLGTGKYIEYLPGFLNSLDKFQISEDKSLLLFTDNEEALNYYNGRSINGVYCLTSQIEHLPWPLIALLKFHYLKKGLELVKNLGFRVTHVYYMNSNVKFLDNVNLPTIDKLIGIPHHYINFLTEEEKLNLHSRVKESISYIESPSTYLQSGFVGGPLELMNQLINKITEDVNFDLKNNVIAKWHDESHYNRYYVDNKDQFEIIDSFWGSEEFLETLGRKVMLRDSTITEKIKNLN